MMVVGVDGGADDGDGNDRPLVFFAFTDVIVVVVVAPLLVVVAAVWLVVLPCYSC